MIKVLLWDIDGTVLNFLEAEKAAIRKGFERLNMGVCTDEMLKRYSAINRRYWEALERGEMTKPEILVGRFREFFTSEGLDGSQAEVFNSHYQVDLGDTVCFCDRADELLPRLKKEYRQYAVTNGTAVAQHRKLKLSGLEEILDGWFISDELGVEKPAPEFFEKALTEIEKVTGPLKPDEILIIGDSLTSDMKGGENAGIRTCWYNPEEKPNDKGVRTDYVIRNLNELPMLLTEIE